MMNKKFALGIMSFLVAGACVAQSTLLRLPPIDKSPVLDGKIGLTEWASGSTAFGGISDKTKLLTFRKSNFYFSYDNNYIYFGVSSELPPPPQKLNEANTVGITLRPPKSERIYDFSFNSQGKGNLPQGSKVANAFVKDEKTDKKYECWETEVAIPLAALGVQAIADGEAWGLQMGRNWKNDDEAGFWHLPAKAGEMGIFIPDKTAVAVSFDGFGQKYFDFSSYTYAYRVANPTNEVQNVYCNSEIVSIEVPYKIMGTLKLQPGESGKVEQSGCMAYPGTLRTLVGTVINSKTNVKYYDRSFQWDLNKAIRWYDPSSPPKLEAAFYPSYKKLRVKVSSNDTAKLKAYKSVKVQVNAAKGHAFCEIKPELRQSDWYKLADLPELPLGEYVVALDVIDQDGKRFTDERTFAVRQFAWQNNDIGTEKIILPPFKPLKVDKAKNSVSALQTGYRIKGAFWDAVYAEAENILAAPIELTINGEKFNPVSAKLVSAADDKVVYETVVKYKALNLTVVHEYEYDGMCKATLKFDPGSGIDIKELYLEIPLKKEYAKLFFAAVSSTDNPAKFLPDGQGEVWNTSKEKITVSPTMPGYWTPYFWFGESYKGICWFNENQRGWNVEVNTPVQKVLRTDKAATFRVTFINKATSLNKPFELVMGFQPTPVKPQPVGYRKLHGVMWSDAWHPDKAHILTLGGDSPLGMAEPSYGVFNPVNGDYSFINYVLQRKWRDMAELQAVADAYVARTKIDEKFFMKWFYANTPRVEQMYEVSRFRDAKYLCYYMDPMMLSCEWPENEMYKSEWFVRDYPFENYMNLYMCNLPESHIDKLLHDARRIVRGGMDGIYFDCFSLICSQNTMVSKAVEVSPGAYMPCYNIFEWRELMKRTATMLMQENKTIFGRPFLWLHTSNWSIVPVNSFMTMQYDYELNSHKGDWQNRFPEDYVLAEALGTQTGLAPVIMVNTLGKNPEHTAKTLLAHMFAYDLMSITDTGTELFPFLKNAINAVFNFGYGDANVKVYPYWGKEKPPVMHDGKDVLMTTLKRDDNQAMLMIGNLGDRVKVTFDISGLGYKSCIIKDAETGKALSTGQKVTIDLPGHEYALLMVKAEE